MESSSLKMATTELSKLTEHHFVLPVPNTASEQKPQKRCKMCYKKGMHKDSHYNCQSCPSNPQFYYPRFELYHTKLITGCEIPVHQKALLRFNSIVHSVHL